MMHSSMLTVVSFALLSLVAPAQVVAGRAKAGSLARRAPIPLPEPAPAAEAQRAPSSSPPHSRRKRTVAPPSSDTPLVKQRSNRSASKHDKRSWINPKPRRTPINPKFTKRSKTPTTTYSIDQESMGGYSFFDNWDWFTYPDPTHGWVDYNSKQDSWDNGLVYVPEPARNTTIMRVDSWSNLPYGALRNSVRISSKQKVEIGSIVVADIVNIPYGPTVWGAFWMVGDNWPLGGEIDILEAVHNSVQNQYTLHTAPGCTLSTPMDATGSILSTQCNAFENFNTGCGVQDSSKTSYGSAWNENGGGVSVTHWDESGISMWRFLRDEIPSDITAGNPDPTQWGKPAARFDSSTCDMNKYFGPQSLVFDITLGGDWAGATYNAAGFSGSWEDAIKKASNFEQAFWEVGYVKVFKRDT